MLNNQIFAVLIQGIIANFIPSASAQDMWG